MAGENGMRSSSRQMARTGRRNVGASPSSTYRGISSVQQSRISPAKRACRRADRGRARELTAVAATPSPSPSGRRRQTLLNPFRKEAQGFHPRRPLCQCRLTCSRSGRVGKGVRKAMVRKPSHKWAFKRGMRAGTFGWRSSAKAIGRLKSASTRPRGSTAPTRSQQPFGPQRTQVAEGPEGGSRRKGGSCFIW
jgi:hypothetical protein